jgi:23S rRNA (cytidine1920-2'-O)/16S rRNA (cytidine1409-2'-O)-methyltransferase
VSRRRLDLVLVDRGLAASRMRAQAMIMAGEVVVDGTMVTKPGTPVPPDAPVDVRPRRKEFASRGGLKLTHALDAFRLDVRGKVVLDAGASTGGFTDCLLQRGAARVYAVDVGTGQLAWSLRSDPRVVSLEQQDVRSLVPDALDAPVELATVDVSFVSLFKVLPAVIRLVRPGGSIVALLKPQFEVGPKVAKGGVVREPAAHAAVLREALVRAAAAGLTVRAVTPSPIPGPEGNLEFFLLLDANPTPARGPIDVEGVVVDAHAQVRKRSGELAVRPDAGAR